ncbi:MAG: hypothetical protein JKY65_25705 [Planctomycetes bacterium]|nr:hypothetical protein [Planctomycetota bacterium]
MGGSAASRQARDERYRVWEERHGASVQAVAAESSARAFDSVCEELVPWALGYSDPVRDRVEARLREAAGE